MHNNTLTHDDMQQLDRDMKEAVSRSSARNNQHPFEFLHVSKLTIRPTSWLIYNVLPFDSIGFISGEWGTYKSFIALDMLLCVASGHSYHGHEVKQRPVFYICGEGHGGIAKRVKAWSIENGIEVSELPFYISTVPAKLLEEDNVESVYTAIKQTAVSSGQNPGLIIIDTMARNLCGGNESDSGDIGMMYNHLTEYWRQPFECCIGIIAHVGHGDKGRPRGSYDIEASADFSYLVKKPDSTDNECILECQKLKDEPIPPPIGFIANQHAVGVSDECNNSITSLALSISDKPIEKKSKAGKTKKSGNYRKQKLILYALHEAIEKGDTYDVSIQQQRIMLNQLHGKDDVFTPDYPTKAVTRSTFREYAYQQSFFSYRDQYDDESDKVFQRKSTDAKRKKFERYLDDLIVENRIFTGIIYNEELFWPSTNTKPKLNGEF